MMQLKTTATLALWAIALLLSSPVPVRAQAGPPFLTNDPGTPGNGNWEISIASMQTECAAPTEAVIAPK
jgi:hypothetical protein